MDQIRRRRRWLRYRRYNGTNQFWGYGFAGLSREADVVFTWGSGGKMESVMDITHNVAVPFNTQAAASWGFVTDADGSGFVDWLDPPRPQRGGILHQ